VAEDLSATHRRWELGGVLRRIREGQGKTIEQVSQDLSRKYGHGFSAAKIGRLETGRRGAIPRDVRDLCEYYEVDPEERDRLVTMARDIRQDRSLQWVSDSYAEFIALESIAKAVRDYEPMFVPGLMQTPDYYQVVVDAHTETDLAPEFTYEWLQSSMEIRRKRQSRLTGDNPLHYHAVLDENVIRRRVGSRKVMAEQLEHLINLSYLENIEIRVIPVSRGVYPGCESGGFALFEYDQGEHLQDNVCYVEGLVSAFWSGQITQRQHIAEIFSNLEAISLDQEGSRALIDEARRALQEGS
jgi:transcriptional regulator with XRE-family HTH domain